MDLTVNIPFIRLIFCGLSVFLKLVEIFLVCETT